MLQNCINAAKLTILTLLTEIAFSCRKYLSIEQNCHGWRNRHRGMGLFLAFVRIIASIILTAVISFIFKFDYANDVEAIEGAWVVSTIFIFAIGSLTERA
jgi:hypothetical protein